MSGKRVLFGGHNKIFARALKVPEAPERDNVSAVGITTKNDSHQRKRKTTLESQSLLIYNLSRILLILG